jgi:hypothetical protein
MQQMLLSWLCFQSSASKVGSSVLQLQGGATVLLSYSSELQIYL